MQVAQPAIATLGDEGPLAVGIQVGQDRAAVQVLDDRADRHAQLHVRAGAAVAVGTAAVLPPFGPEQPRVAEIDQGVEVAVRDGPDAAAAAAVAAVRPAPGNEFLPAEGHGAVAAVAGNDLDLRLVEEFHRCSQPREPKEKALSVKDRASRAGPGTLRPSERC